MASDPSHFYSDTYRNLADPISNFLASTVEKIITEFSPMITSFLIIYCFIWGWALLNGSVKEPFMDGLRRVVRLGFIAGLAMSVGIYNGYIVDTFWNIPDALGKLVAPGSINTPTVAFSFLDTVFDQFFDCGDIFYQKASGLKLSNIGLMLMAMAIWIAGIVTTCGAFILLLAVKITLASALAIGPIMISMTIFEATRKFCDQWLSIISTAIAGSLLTIIFINLVLKVLDRYVQAVGSDFTIKSALPLIIFAAIAGIYYMQIPHLAQTYGGGAAIGSMGLGRAIGGKVMGSASGAANGAKNLATGKTLSDVRANRREKHVNSEWSKRHPGTASKGAQWAVNKMRGNSVKKTG